MTSAYIELAFACLINWTMYTSSSENDIGLWINNIYLCASSLLVVVYPIGLYVFLRINYYELQYKYNKVKFENAYSGIELYDNISAIWVPVLYFLLRAVLAACCVCLTGMPVFQFLTLFTCQIIQITYLGHVHPYDTRAELQLDLFNEAYIFVMLYHLMCLTANNTEHVELR